MDMTDFAKTESVVDNSAEPEISAPKVHVTGRNVLSMPGHQVHALYKLRVDVFVNEQRAPFPEIDDTDALPNTHHILAYVHPGNGPSYPHGTPDPGSPLRLVGTCRVFGPPEAQHLGRLCVSADMRGYGIAHQLVQEALEVCISRAAALDPSTNAPIVKIEAQTYLDDFYRTYGFKEAGDRFVTEGIEHVEMHLDLDEYKMRVAKQER